MAACLNRLLIWVKVQMVTDEAGAGKFQSPRQHLDGSSTWEAQHMSIKHKPGKRGQRGQN